MEYAEEFTRKDKITRITIYIVLGAMFFALFQYVLEPLIIDFSGRPHCYELLGYNGADIVWYLMLFYFPFSLFILSSLFILPTGIRGIKEGRFPPKRFKVYKPTVVKRGMIGYIKSGLFIFIPMILLFMSLFGYHEAGRTPPLDKQKLSMISCFTDEA